MAKDKGEKMIYVVYHFDMNKYSCSFDKWYSLNEIAGTREPCEAPKFPEEYRPVAAVEADDIEEVFNKTNHIDTDWADNDGVIPIGAKARSTSVGDVVVCAGEKARLCTRSICLGKGWKEI